MRVVFMGTPGLSARILESLADRHTVVAVYTRPDAVRGRGKKLAPSPVKQLALEHGIPVHTPSTLRDGSVRDELAALEPDMICVAAYGAILPPDILRIPAYGCINVHTSLLPRWRGAAPIQRAILAGDATTGVCIMQMEEGLDTGAVCKRVEVDLDALYLDEAEQLLAQAGSRALIEAMDEIERGRAKWIAQDPHGVSYAEKIGKGELGIDPTDNAGYAGAKVRASNDAHPAAIRLADRRVTVIRASVADDMLAQEAGLELEPGQAIFRAKRLLLRMADGILEIHQLKPEGRKSMDARSFAAGIQGIKNMTISWGRA